MTPRAAPEDSNVMDREEQLAALLADLAQAERCITALRRSVRRTSVEPGLAPTKWLIKIVDC